MGESIMRLTFESFLWYVSYVGLESRFRISFLHFVRNVRAVFVCGSAVCSEVRQSDYVPVQHWGNVLARILKLDICFPWSHFANGRQVYINESSCLSFPCTCFEHA